ncbi:MAG: ImmA/IrrE family metallo-endopeptidase [Candidatus Melainabacteria bacterium]|nr:ImmA/IrrE family metallo-endopeptidase [Candidatus Melainabacteria bacterium]
MLRIRRQFGQRFAYRLSKSPTLLSDLKLLRKRHVKIRRVRHLWGAYSVSTTKTIYIGADGAVTDQLLHLAHEAYHILFGETPEPSPRRMSRRQYLRMMLDEEADAQVHELSVLKEFMQAGYHLPAHRRDDYRRYRFGGGRAALRKALLATETYSDELYPAFYRRQYDESCN